MSDWRDRDGERPRVLPPAALWLQYLVAILLGNAIYFWSLVPHLPEWLRHRPFHLDAGLGMDFLVCAAVYWLMRAGRRQLPWGRRGR